MSYMKEMKEYYKLSSKDLSIESLKSLRITSTLGLLATIMGLLMIWSVIPLNVFTGSTLALGLVFGFIALFHRLPNLLSISEKHLDEWGCAAKKEAEAFTCRVVFRASIVMSLAGFAFLSSDSIEDLSLVLTPTFEQLAGTFFLITVLLQMITTNRLAWSVQPLSKEDVMEMYEIENPRKQGNWITIWLMCFLFAGIFVGKSLDYKYADIAESSAQNCEISVNADIPLAYVKNLRGCGEAKENHKKESDK